MYLLIFLSYLSFVIVVLQCVDAIFYYLWKNSKKQNTPICRYTIADYFFKINIDKAYKNYYSRVGEKVLSFHEVFARLGVVP